MKITGQPLYFTNAAEWRAWLQVNHASQDEIWLLMYKKSTGVPCISFRETAEEAMCFGWVDSVMQRVDDETYALRFTQRKPGSAWSEGNKKRAEMLIGQGRMAEPGLAKIEEAKRNGQWDKAEPS